MCPAHNFLSSLSSLTWQLEFSLICIHPSTILHFSKLGHTDWKIVSNIAHWFENKFGWKIKVCSWLTHITPPNLYYRSAEDLSGEWPFQSQLPLHPHFILVSVYYCLWLLHWQRTVFLCADCLRLSLSQVASFFCATNSINVRCWIFTCANMYARLRLSTTVIWS